MRFLCFPIRSAACSLALSLTLGACSQQQAPLRAQSKQPVNFSGHWELDYAQSDNLQARLNALVRELRKQNERRGASGEIGGGPALVVGGVGNSGDSIIGLARMADLITQSALLTVSQDAEGIKVKREGNFALDCQFTGDTAYRVDSPLGRELCGWDGHQMVFTLLLPEGLSIRHRLTLSPDRQHMNIASTVISDRVSEPFTLNRVYNRFDPATTGYHCKMTLTRGRVCTTESQ